ncbi:5-(carboxyamino)imidazole ribonucleotide synthase [Thermoactinomyces sp. DSM 45892]|uniref:5-(carboxyamino)imidazole ribonucleotide synthase n=1 Tax=Thermoactinomyces sp. DSM 45892 TaxID=1882753 RepID=UPI00089C2E6F|nr:5-(carboxyamino)imidazole ribonucleotide synthase [Thermoactinomyces sp. DSM 45892]SDZ26072.1 5-(carboxyamino)imidazole ribonucleotide synthase [Thermoactinomyces sp. DSM 45892]
MRIQFTQSESLLNSLPKKESGFNLRQSNSIPSAPLVVPGQTIGVLGGGQLGRMIILEGRRLGYRFVVLDPDIDSPAGQVADEQIIGEYDSPMAMERMIDKSDLVIYEFENIDLDTVRMVEAIKPLPQGSNLLRWTKHRGEERKVLQDAQIPIAPYQIVTSKAQMLEAIEELQLPCVLKTLTGGYDGKGQWVVRALEDPLPPLEVIERGILVEKFVPYVKEISVIVARGVSEEVEVYPPVMNIHRNQMLHMTISPAPIKEGIRERAEKIAYQLASQLWFVGVLAIEMFVLADGTILVNELAPRPHNSGHITMDITTTCQFEQFIRAVTGLPLSKPARKNSGIMVNLLGEHQDAFFGELTKLPPCAKIHWYGKSVAKEGRKMGHINFVGDSLQDLLELVNEIPIWNPLSGQEWGAIFSIANHQIESRRLYD